MYRSVFEIARPGLRDAAEFGPGLGLSEAAIEPHHDNFLLPIRERADRAGELFERLFFFEERIGERLGGTELVNVILDRVIRRIAELPAASIEDRAANLLPAVLLERLGSAAVVFLCRRDEAEHSKLNEIIGLETWREPPFQR